MERSMSATEARVHFGDLLDRVAKERETVIVERGGVPRAVMISIDEYERLLARRDGTTWRDQARAARDLVRAELGETAIPLAEDVIRAMRAERDEQLAELR